jgi:hypothetical protein
MAASLRIQCHLVTLTKISRCRTALNETCTPRTPFSHSRAGHHDRGARLLRLWMTHLSQQTKTKRGSQQSIGQPTSPRLPRLPSLSPAAPLRTGRGCQSCLHGRLLHRRCRRRSGTHLKNRLLPRNPHPPKSRPPHLRGQDPPAHKRASQSLPRISGMLPPRTATTATMMPKLMRLDRPLTRQALFDRRSGAV